MNPEKAARISGVILSIIVGALDAATIETEGTFSLNSFGSNLRMSLVEKVGYVPGRNVCFSIFGEQSFANNSFASSLFAGMEYRIGPELIQVPAGAFAGVQSMYVGHYSESVPVFGINSGLIFWLDKRVSLRVNYLAKLYFKDRTTPGNDLLIGFSYAFGTGRSGGGRPEG